MNNDKLMNLISKQLTNQTETVIRKLQKANCDALGIGNIVKARYPAFWRNHKWKEIYPNMDISTNVKAVIIGHGIME